MKMLTYSLIAGAFFWAGVVITESRQLQPAQIIPVYKTPRMFLSCDPQMEKERKWICAQRKKSL